MFWPAFRMSVTSGFSYFLLDALCSWKNPRLSSTRSQQDSRSPRKFLKPNRTGPSARKTAQGPPWGGHGGPLLQMRSEPIRFVLILYGWPSVATPSSTLCKALQHSVPNFTRWTWYARNASYRVLSVYFRGRRGNIAHAQPSNTANSPSTITKLLPL